MSEMIEPATKADLAVLKTDLRAELSEVRAELSGVKTELSEAIVRLGADLRAEMQTMRADLRAEMQTMGADLRGEVRTMRIDIEATLVQAINSAFERFRADFGVLDDRDLALRERQDATDREIATVRAELDAHRVDARVHRVQRKR
jgi:capsule polysaccharide export protein KpsE/RkpR